MRAIMRTTLCGVALSGGLLVLGTAAASAAETESPEVLFVTDDAVSTEADVAVGVDVLSEDAVVDATADVGLDAEVLGLDATADVPIDVEVLTDSQPAPNQERYTGAEVTADADVTLGGTGEAVAAEPVSDVAADMAADADVTLGGAGEAVAAEPVAHAAADVLADADVTLGGTGEAVAAEPVAHAAADVLADVGLDAGDSSSGDGKGLTADVCLDGALALGGSATSSGCGGTAADEDIAGDGAGPTGGDSGTGAGGEAPAGGEGTAGEAGGAAPEGADSDVDREATMGISAVAEDAGDASAGAGVAPGTVTVSRGAAPGVAIASADRWLVAADAGPGADGAAQGGNMLAETGWWAGNILWSGLLLIVAGAAVSVSRVRTRRLPIL